MLIRRREKKGEEGRRREKKGEEGRRREKKGEEERKFQQKNNLTEQQQNNQSKGSFHIKSSDFTQICNPL